MTFKIESKDIQLVDISKLVFNPKNNNKHPDEQIDRLAKLIEHHGFRNPIVVSNRTGFVVAGHGRIMAARKLGINIIPVMYQDFDNEAQEYAYLTSDNAIASWAELDLSMVTLELTNLGPEFTNLELLGIKSIESLKDVFFEEGTIDDQGQLDEKQMTKCPNCGEEFDHAKHKA